MWSARAVVMFPTGVKLALAVGPDVVDDVGLAVVDAGAMELLADGILPQDIRTGTRRNSPRNGRVRRQLVATFAFTFTSSAPALPSVLSTKSRLCSEKTSQEVARAVFSFFGIAKRLQHFHRTYQAGCRLALPGVSEPPGSTKLDFTALGFNTDSLTRLGTKTPPGQVLLLMTVLLFWSRTRLSRIT